jgi:L-asparagine transporter-like permease
MVSMTQMEFWFSSLKVISLIGLMLMVCPVVAQLYALTDDSQSIVIDLGGNPKVGTCVLTVFIKNLIHVPA